jgi:serine/threonine protein kinase
MWVWVKIELVVEIDKGGPGRTNCNSGHQKMVKSVGKYDLYRTLGEGSYGKVKYGVNKETKEAVAIKVSRRSKMQRPFCF